MDDLPGSSPLARGLRHQPADRRDGPGIIPARAGFTKLFLVMGVPFPGSSPLARGLHGAADHDHDGPGIIPARAGFTTASRTTRSTTWDHPRSRGVYMRMRWLGWRTAGSSPLARGLRGDLGGGGAGGGIIPARAGFTPRPASQPNAPTDHPRSRGVYPGQARGGARPCGSSPLARGLLGAG